MDPIKVGLFIAQSRKQQNLTQGDLAKALHVSDQAVSKWERGLNYPDISLLSDLATLLKVSVTEILHGERNTMEPQTQDEVKTVLDYSSTVLKKEKNRFSKELMLLRLVIALAIAALMNAYFR